MAAASKGPPGKSVAANKPPSDTPQSQVHHHSSASTGPPGLQNWPGRAFVYQCFPLGAGPPLLPSPPRLAGEPQCQPPAPHCRPGSITEAKARFTPPHPTLPPPLPTSPPTSSLHSSPHLTPLPLPTSHSTPHMSPTTPSSQDTTHPPSQEPFKAWPGHVQPILRGAPQSPFSTPRASARRAQRRTKTLPDATAGGKCVRGSRPSEEALSPVCAGPGDCPQAGTRACALRLQHPQHSTQATQVTPRRGHDEHGGRDPQ